MSTSRVHGYPRQFSEVGVAKALVESLEDGRSSPSFVVATIPLNVVTMNFGVQFDI